MTFPPKPNRGPLTPSSPKTSCDPGDDQETQLSASDGVENSVSTAALDPAMLLATGHPVPAVYPGDAGPEAQTDADVMLRVKAGEQTAFDYRCRNIAARS